MVALFCLLKSLSMNDIKNWNNIFWVYEDGLYDRGYLMTPSEEIFFKRLCEYVKDKDYIVCPKVRLGDVIDIEKKRWHRIWNFIGRPWTVSGKLNRSHIDFVLIGKKNSMIKLAIELDDPKTHHSPYARYHDKIKNEAFKHVNIPLLRFQKAEVTEDEIKYSWI